jgi:hypothetical protein
MVRAGDGIVSIKLLVFIAEVDVGNVMLDLNTTVGTLEAEYNEILKNNQIL